jgi:hypothetical protein
LRTEVSGPLRLHFRHGGLGDRDGGGGAGTDPDQPGPGVRRVRRALDVAGPLELVDEEACGLLGDLRLLGQFGQPGAIGTDPLEDPALREGDITEARGVEGCEDPVLRGKAAHPPERLVADLRRITGSRLLAPGQSQVDPLMDILVHGQDIVLPLGRHREMPLDAARVSADKVWNVGFPFHARKWLSGFRLTATDVPWSRGEGTSSRGPSTRTCSCSPGGL